MFLEGPQARTKLIETEGEGDEAAVAHLHQSSLAASEICMMDVITAFHETEKLPLISRNRLVPSYINITTTHTTVRQLLGQIAEKRPREKKTRRRKEKLMLTTEDQLNEDVPQPLRPPKISTTLLALRHAAYQATPSRRSATMTTLLPGLILGFPRYAWGSGEGYTRRPSGRKGGTHKRHRVGAGHADMDFSQPSYIHYPDDS